MKRLLFLGFLLLLAAASSAPAEAATANFQANCTAATPNDCVFDPQRAPAGQPGTSCAPSTIRRYFWDFGDGTSFFRTPPPHQTSHSFPAGTNEVWICLTVFCNDNTSDTKCHCFSNVVGFGGCIIPGASWTPP